MKRRLRTPIRDGGGDFPAVGLLDAQLSQRQGRARAVGLPVTRWRGRKRLQRQQIMAHVECGVRADERDGLSDRDADTAAFDDDVVLEPAHQPDAGRVLQDDEAQALIGLHAPGISNVRDSRRVTSSIVY